jgi:hypothetical protein
VSGLFAYSIKEDYMHLKVQDGTRSVMAPRLCDSCQSGMVYRGAADSNERVYCRQMERHLQIGVVECSSYRNRKEPDLYDMRQIAWVLDLDRKRQRIGFTPVKEWERAHEDEELLPVVTL